MIFLHHGRLVWMMLTKRNSQEEDHRAEHVPGFPSGQRGWTQDPLRNASQVRILPPAPSFHRSSSSSCASLVND